MVIHGDWSVQGQITLCADWLMMALKPIVVIVGSIGPWLDFVCSFNSLIYESLFVLSVSDIAS